jgi:hypothetical protein
MLKELEAVREEHAPPRLGRDAVAEHDYQVLCRLG